LWGNNITKKQNTLCAEDAIFNVTNKWVALNVSKTTLKWSKCSAIDLL
jgi:hypothetical protein